MHDIAEVKDLLLTLALSMARIVPIFTIAPFLGASLMPRLVRNSVILGLTIVVFPAVAATVDTDLGFTPHVAVLLLKELGLGLMLGYLLSMVFWTISSAGFIIDNQRGSTMAQSLDPLMGEMSSPMGGLFFQVFTMLFIISGGIFAFIGFVYESYRMWPVLSFVPNLSNPAMPTLFMGEMDKLARYVLLFAAPMLITCFLVDMGMGLMNRFSPQLNVFFLAMPIKSGLIMFLLVLYMAVLFDVFMVEIRAQGGLLGLLAKAIE